MTITGILHYMNTTSSELQFFQTQAEDPGFSFFGAIFFLVPLVMAFLSVTLKDVANRRTNIVLSIIFLIIHIVHILGCPVAHSSAHQILIGIAPIVVSLLIIGYAWKWPKDQV
jgi:uncharacterized membrane protein HdeD (DUF308 family)